MRFEDSRHPRTRAGGGMLGALGITGGLIRTATMVLPALGAGGPAPAPRRGTRPGCRCGPVLGDVRPVQPSDPVMYLTLALGFTGWLATYLWTRRARCQRLPRPNPLHPQTGSTPTTHRAGRGHVLRGALPDAGGVRRGGASDGTVRGDTRRRRSAAPGRVRMNVPIPHHGVVDGGRDPAGRPGHPSAFRGPTHLGQLPRFPNCADP